MFKALTLSVNLNANIHTLMRFQCFCTIFSLIVMVFQASRSGMQHEIPTWKKSQDYVYGKREYTGTWQKYKSYLWREHNENKKYGVNIFRDIKIIIYIYMNKRKQNNENTFFPMVNLQNRTTVVYNQFPKNGLTCRRQMVNPRHPTLQGQSVAKPGTPL